MCILNVRRAVHRGLSLREGVLAKASAVRPRATPRTQKRVHTNNTDTEQTTRTRCAVYATTRNRTAQGCGLQDQAQAQEWLRVLL